jgi:hypothetical protein
MSHRECESPRKAYALRGLARPKMCSCAACGFVSTGGFHSSEPDGFEPTCNISWGLEMLGQWVMATAESNPSALSQLSANWRQAFGHPTMLTSPM